ncbi:MAG: hypothetical protein P1V19_20100 [Gimesia sp.]|nr:hypothetical protein [Gimesia sp.]
MTEIIRVMICAPPHREKHVAEISLQSDESLEPGFDGVCHPIGEVTVDNGRLEFEIYAVNESERRVFNCKELLSAIQEAIDRLVEIYPQYSSGPASLE